MYCKHCGKELPNEAATCPHCGVSTGNAPVQTNHSDEKTARDPFGTVGFVLSVIACFVSLVFYSMAFAHRFGGPVDFVLLPAFSGLIFDIFGLHRAKTQHGGKGFALAGLILSSIAIGYAFLYYLYLF